MSVAAAVISGIAAIVAAGISAASTGASAQATEEGEAAADRQQRRYDRFARMAHQQEYDYRLQELEMKKIGQREQIRELRRQQKRENREDVRMGLRNAYATYGSLLAQRTGAMNNTSNVWR